MGLITHQSSFVNTKSKSDLLTVQDWKVSDFQTLGRCWKITFHSDPHNPELAERLRAQSHETAPLQMVSFKRGAPATHTSTGQLQIQGFPQSPFPQVK